MALDEFRRISRHDYLTDFSFLNGGAFPTAEMIDRASVYKFRRKEYSGEYAYEKRLIARVNGGAEENWTPVQYILSYNIYKFSKIYISLSNWLLTYLLDNYLRINSLTYPKNIN